MCVGLSCNAGKRRTPSHARKRRETPLSRSARRAQAVRRYTHGLRTACALDDRHEALPRNSPQKRKKAMKAMHVKDTLALTPKTRVGA